ncbi:Protein of unknown function [Pyronema omphalodes CBS 100304]|uniref:Uncharacterized protein n=1 Tax=Pyronema omphalodes (strain CBS 100304) TaxID=1076935 RepID=U4KW71_PYROM|nr:Protein of unknown function [Pyronema omphalodes CBS 100304]
MFRLKSSLPCYFSLSPCLHWYTVPSSPIRFDHSMFFSVVD